MKKQMKSKVKKVIKGLKKASKSHAAQAKTLQSIVKKGKTKK
jgi:hypothetical protein